MSKAEETFNSFEGTAATWMAALDEYSPEQFGRKPSEEEWSIGQVYNHLIGMAYGLQLRSMETCLAGNGEVSEGGKTPPGEITFATGNFPVPRIKVPASPQYTPSQPEDIEGVRGQLAALVDTMRASMERVTSYDPLMKAPHPALGLLNADEWYQSVEIHFRHHLGQKERLDTWLATPTE